MLPSLFPTADTKYKLIPLNIKYSSKMPIQNSYQQLLCNWYGKECIGVLDNSFRKTKKNFVIFEKIRQGDNYTDVVNIAEQILEEKIKGYEIEKNDKSYLKFRDTIIPKAAKNKFEGKWRELDENKQSHTVVAHLSKDTYSHIHPW